MNSGKRLPKRDTAILRHLLYYRVSFTEVIKCLYFRGADPKKVLDRLRKNDYIKAVGGFAKNRKAYFITTAGAAAIGVELKRQHLGSRARFEREMLLCFCFLCGASRTILKASRLKRLLGGTTPPGKYYCAERGTRTPHGCVYELYVPERQTAVRSIVDRMVEGVSRARSFEPLQALIDAHLYRFAVLVETDARAVEIVEALRKAQVDGIPIDKAARLLVQRVPAIGNTLEEALHVISVA